MRDPSRWLVSAQRFVRAEPQGCRTVSRARELRVERRGSTSRSPQQVCQKPASTLKPRRCLR
eukprot:3146861-Rhodomonas_salina.1